MQEKNTPDFLMCVVSELCVECGIVGIVKNGDLVSHLVRHYAVHSFNNILIRSISLQNVSTGVGR